MQWKDAGYNVGNDKNLHRMSDFNGLKSLIFSLRKTMFTPSFHVAICTISLMDSPQYAKHLMAHSGYRGLYTKNNFIGLPRYGWPSSISLQFNVYHIVRASFKDQTMRTRLVYQANFSLIDSFA